MSTLKTQGKEFDAAAAYVRQFHRLTATPIVDDDYPEVRHDYESALAAMIDAMKMNGRFDCANRYGLSPTRRT